jgi:DNA polymerase I-like protein with 3'-5' exonuclease and polymerase domains
VRVDLDQAQIYKKKLISEEQKLLQEIKKETGIELEMWASRNIQKIFDKLKIKYGTTEKGNPSFTKIFLQNHQHPIPKKIVKAREINKAHTTFIDTILDHSVNSRIHADIHQLRDGESGTVTGRFSMSNPNLQQIPARDEYIGPMIRSLFLPEVGQKWGSFDYSQQEPRLVVHYASLTKLEGADKVLEAYKTDPNADFHTMMADMANIDRKIAKVVNLGLFYGMGINKLANELGVDKVEAKTLYERYNNKVPFVKQLAEACSYKAATEGFIRTLLGRLCRFDKWEPVAYGVHTALPRKEAEREYGTYLKRAMTFKALNRLIQGSAADQIKKSMVDLSKLGYIPLIQIHDELAISVNNDDLPVIKKAMEESVPSMIVPSKVDISIGNNWGEAMG